MITLFALVLSSAAVEDKQAALADVAACVVVQAPERTASFLATVPGSKEEGQALGKLSGLETCLRQRTIVSARTGEIRGALAEAALRNAPSKLTALNARSASAVTRISERAAGSRAFVVAYGQCLASASPAQAVSLIGTEHGSDKEKTALMALGESLKACMPEGVAYQINIRDVRNHVADALYRMSETPIA